MTRQKSKMFPLRSLQVQKDDFGPPAYQIKSVLDIAFSYKEFCFYRALFSMLSFQGNKKLNIGELLPLLSLSY